MKLLSLLLLAVLLDANAFADDAPLSLPPSDTVAAPSTPLTTDSVTPPPPIETATPITPTAAPAPIAPPVEVAPAKSPEPAPKENLSEQPSAKQLLDQRLDKEKKEAEDQKVRQNKELVTHEAAGHNFELDYVVHAFPNANYSNVAGTTSSGSSSGAALQFMFFPLTHGIGRFGLGVNAAAYKSTSQSLSGSKLTFLTGGAKATFELQPFVAQVFIPFAVAGVDYVNSGSSISMSPSSFSSPYYGGGLAIDLNSLERAAASEALIDTGVRKVMLAYTFQQRTGSNSKQNGSAHFFGLRFEY